MRNKVMSVIKKLFYVFLFLIGFVSMLCASYYFVFNFLDSQYELPNFSTEEERLIENVRQYEIDEGNFNFVNWVGYKIEKNDLGYLIYMYPGDGDQMSWKMFLFALSDKRCCGQKKYQLDRFGHVVPEKNDTLLSGPSVFVDPRDGKRYRTMRIGDKVWMLDNLNYKPSYQKIKFHVFDNMIWQYERNNVNFCIGYKESNCKRFGRLYDFSSAISSCPDGWRLPTSTEWISLKSLKDYSLFVKQYPGMALKNYEGVYEFLHQNEMSLWWLQPDSGGFGAYSINAFKKENNAKDGFYSNSHVDGLISVRCIKNNF